MRPVELLIRRVDQRKRTVWPKATENFELLSFRFIVRNKELLNFVNEIVVQVSQEANVRMIARICGHGDEPIVPRGLLTFSLFGLDDAN